ncbi:MAG TPA: hypothetical protein VHD91_08480 [Gaiellaceae bacterium]|nr:hypothetical protein [Gaiellaceae bacterium]
MAEATTTGAFLVSLKATMAARLAAIQGLRGVKVGYVPPAAEEVPLGDFLYLVRGAITVDDELATAKRSRSRDEAVVIPGAVQAYEVGDDGDAAFQAALDRAETILDELIEQLRDTPPEVGQQTRSAIVRRIRWTPSPSAKGGWVVRGEFDLHYSSRVP